jgi:hypothetical protein
MVGYLGVFLGRSSKPISSDPTPYISSQQTTDTVGTIKVEPSSAGRKGERGRWRLAPQSYTGLCFGPSL